MNNLKVKFKYYFIFFFSFLLYFIVNEVIAHIALILSEGRLVGNPLWIGRFCNVGTGYSYKDSILYAIWFMTKVIFVFGVYYIFLKRGYFVWLRFVLGVYLVTGILHVVLSVLISFVEWDSYFFSCFPLFELMRMTGYPGWWFMLAETLFFLGLYSMLNKVKLKEHLFHFAFVPFSFLLYFLGCYLHFGFVITYK